MAVTIHPRNCQRINRDVSHMKARHAKGCTCVCHQVDARAVPKQVYINCGCLRSYIDMQVVPILVVDAVISWRGDCFTPAPACTTHTDFSSPFCHNVNTHRCNQSSGRQPSGLRYDLQARAGANPLLIKGRCCR